MDSLLSNLPISVEFIQGLTRESYRRSLGIESAIYPSLWIY